MQRSEITKIDVPRVVGGREPPRGVEDHPLIIIVVSENGIVTIEFSSSKTSRNISQIVPKMCFGVSGEAETPPTTLGANLARFFTICLLSHLAGTISRWWK